MDRSHSSGVKSSDAMTRQNSRLRRRNSIAASLVVPAKLTLPVKPHHAASFPNRPTTAAASCSTSSSSSSSLQSFPPVDFELISFKPLAYTSLKDLLPSTDVESPTAAAPVGREISIRNRLVQQAAWAYLQVQPMSTSPGSSGSDLLHRLWTRISDVLIKSPVVAFFRFVTRTVSRAFDRVLRAIRVWSSR